MKTFKILVKVKDERAYFINVGCQSLIGIASAVQVRRRNRNQLGYEINGRVFTDVYKAMNAL